MTASLIIYNDPMETCFEIWVLETAQIKKDGTTIDDLIIYLYVVVFLMLVYFNTIVLLVSITEFFLYNFGPACIIFLQLSFLVFVLLLAVIVGVHCIIYLFQLFVGWFLKLVGLLVDDDKTTT